MLGFLPDDNVFHNKLDLSSHSDEFQRKVSHIWHKQNAEKRKPEVINLLNIHALIRPHWVLL